MLVTWPWNPCVIHSNTFHTLKQESVKHSPSLAVLYYYQILWKIQGLASFFFFASTFSYCFWVATGQHKCVVPIVWKVPCCLSHILPRQWVPQKRLYVQSFALPMDIKTTYPSRAQNVGSCLRQISLCCHLFLHFPLNFLFTGLHLMKRKACWIEYDCKCVRERERDNVHCMVKNVNLAKKN